MQVGDLLVGARRAHPAGVVPLVEAAGEVLEVARDPVRLAQVGRLRHDPREVAQDREQRGLGVVGQQRGVEAVLPVHAVLRGEPGDVGGPGVGVLHVEDRVVVGLLAQLVDVERQRAVGGVAGQGVADGVGADHVDQVVAGSMMLPARLLIALAAAEVDQLADQDLDVVLGVVARTGRNRLEPADVAVVVGAEQVDHLVEAAVLLAGSRRRRPAK